jgi:pimeloyl-ACP methyl ester carboxylesterase
MVMETISADGDRVNSDAARDLAEPAAHDARTEPFRRLQEAALAASGVAVGSRFLDVRTPPIRVQLLEAGAGDPLLMIHGGNSVAAGWVPILPFLASQHRLLMPDRPGCGLTTRFSYRGVDLRSHGVDLVGGLLDALGLQRAVVAGNSIGGFFAMSFALAHPERVSKLVLLGEPAGSAAPAGGGRFRFHRLVGTRGLNRVLYATVLRPPSDATGFRARLARSGLVADPSRVPEALLECLAAGGRLPGAVESWTTMVERAFAPAGSGVLANRMTLTHALLPDLERLTTPTLFLWGDKDPLGTPDDGRRLAERMPHARLEVVRDASHLVWLDQPKPCADAVTAFLDE